MCITEVWSYRECGCYYEHRIPCEPSFALCDSTPQKCRKNGQIHYLASSSSHSPVYTTRSPYSSDASLHRITRQCSIRHVIPKTFLEPICDDCLLDELNLPTEVGPILGGRDRVAGHYDEEWLLESNVEIEIECDEEEQGSIPRLSPDDCDADDEGEFRGRGARRRGMDLSRAHFCINSDATAATRTAPSWFRDQFQRSKSETTKVAGAVPKKHWEGKRPGARPRWPGQWRESFMLMRKNNQDSVLDNGGVIDFSGNSNSRLTDPETNQPSEYETPHRIPDGHQHQDMSHACTVDPSAAMRQISWEEYLRADLKLAPRVNPAALADLLPLVFTNSARQVFSAPSSPQMATPFNSRPWRSLDVERLSIPSSEFHEHDDKEGEEEEGGAPRSPCHPHHAHAKSVDSNQTSSSFQTALSSPC